MENNLWGTSIALDLFLGGIGVGAFLFAVLINYLYQEKYSHASKIASLLTPICVGCGFLFLLAHLGHAERIYVVFTKARWTSPLWWGAWLQTIFFGISVAYAWTYLKDSPPLRRKVLGYVGIPFALAVGVYHGFVLMVFKSVPLWNTGPVTVTAICGFIMSGVALVVLIMSLIPKDKAILHDLQLSRNILGVTILVQLFTLALWMSSLFFGPGQSHQALIRVIVDNGILFWGGAVFLGLILPLVIGLRAILLEKKTGEFSYSVPLITSVMVLIGSLTLRIVVIIAA